MASEWFAIDLAALRAAHDRIGRLAAELNELPHDPPSAEVFGHDRLAEAVNEFTIREKRGVDVIVGEAESIRIGLAETIDTYQKADEDGADGFRDIDL